MKKTIYMLGLSIMLLSGCSDPDQMDQVVNRGLDIARKQALLMAHAMENIPDSLPRSTDAEGHLVKSDSHWWCSGFFPGVLWKLYEACGNDTLRSYAEAFTSRLVSQQFTTDNHDVGFILNCSFGNGYRLTGNKQYAEVLTNGAHSLAKRFNPQVGLIRSWDNHTDQWQYPVIIDNMMNLELMELGYRLSGDRKLDEIARSHARNTMKNHFRADGSSWHVVSYDPQTGIPEKKNTHQGLADGSAWARGQAWGLYGFTMMYRFTKENAFIEQAKRIARFILNHPRMPQDGIPYWDFDDPQIPHSLKDASAGAIMASAFLELSTFPNTGEALGDSCLNMAKRQLQTLTSDQYMAAPGSNGGFILKHSVGNLPGESEVDVPLTYADYYYVEALLRYKNLHQGK